MKFGQVPDPASIDFRLPQTPEVTLDLLNHYKTREPMQVYVGCAKWNKTDLKGFYPKGVKDELSYYSRQFNSIELNATFYNSPDPGQVLTWKEKTPPDFRFFPKIPQSISHFGRLLNTEDKLRDFVDSTLLFGEKLGMTFLQMHDNYKPKDFKRLEDFLFQLPENYPLALEVRNQEWFSDPQISRNLYHLLEETGVANVLVDTAGRRDMLHMRLTTPVAFIRYVGANHPSDYTRLDEWVGVLKQWKSAGLQKLYFFIHQNVELESPLLAAHFIGHLNRELGTALHVPQKPDLN